MPSSGPTFNSTPNLSYTDLYPVYGPTFQLVSVDHSDAPEVRITPYRGPSPSAQIRVGVFAAVFPSWYFAAVSAHCCVAWVVCIDPSNWDFFSSLKLPVPVYLLHQMPELAPVHIVAFNDWCPKPLFRHLLSCVPGDPVFLTDFKIRSWPASLAHCHVSLAHHRTGGVSNATGRFSLACQSFQLITAFQGVDFPTYPHSGLSSILKCTLWGRKHGFVPRRHSLSPSEVHPVKNHSNTFYAHGLYPVGRRQPLFIAPCVFPTTPWTIRKLEVFELGHVFDIPSSAVSALGPAKLQALLFALRYPLKLPSVLMQHLFYYHWPSLAAPLLLGSIHDGVDLRTTTPSPDTSNLRERPSADDGSTIGIPPGGIISSIDVHPGNNMPLRDVNPGGGTALPAVVNSSSPQVTEEERKAVAVKADDAPVPVHVWRTQLERILGIKIPEKIYECGADLFRDKLLRMWRRGLLRDFVLWARREEPELEKEYAWCTGQFNWTCRGQALDRRDATGGGIVHWNRHKKCYTWFRKGTKFSNVGRKRYRESWAMKQRLMKENRSALKECLEKAVGCSWWKWDLGSRLFFWRWPHEFMEEARDGCSCWFQPELLPNYRVPQSPPANPEMFDKIQEKLADVLRKLYMSTNGEIKSLTSFFDVMKGLHDIRMVYNGTSCGLNAACWAPWFPLPTVRTHLQTVKAGTWLADIDLGEMFLNFLLDIRLQAYAGVDLTLYFPELLLDSKSTFWARWTRLLMGFCASPYFATRCLLRARKIILGDRRDIKNPFHWKQAVKNYPGLSTYNPLRPTVYKIRHDGNIASDLHKYIDDLRVTSFGEAAIWESSMQIMTRVNWLGMQNAARKYREGSLKQGAWAGAIVFTPTEVTVSISQTRWDKCKEIIHGMTVRLVDDAGVFEMKKLLADRGFTQEPKNRFPIFNAFFPSSKRIFTQCNIDIFTKTFYLKKTKTTQCSAKIIIDRSQYHNPYLPFTHFNKISQPFFNSSFSPLSFSLPFFTFFSTRMPKT